MNFNGIHHAIAYGLVQTRENKKYKNSMEQTYFGMLEALGCFD